MHCDYELLAHKLQRWNNYITNYHLPEWDAIPDFGLYMDQVIVLLECCPAAAITSVFAVQFGHDEHFAAGSVVLTTLLSIITLPLCALIITMVM